VTPSERVEAALRDRLAGMASGDPLPSIREIAQDHHVANATVVRALARLRAEGLITSRPGWGVFKA
jgi:DNA-binding transcriptional regulator YhcF (GntR family)